MPAQIAIVHGWSDSSRSFHNLRRFLEANGYEVAQIWLGDYISMDDDVRVEDVAKRMQHVVQDAIREKRLTRPFDLIVHSTGGLVAREWLATCYPTGEDAPVKRLVMLAPANFGSKLAAMGKSMIGRVAKGWNNWFQTGEEMLRSLELASPYQWNLARRDLFDVEETGAKGPYGSERVWPFVITGTRAYSTGLRKIVNEYGSDGTVRACAANLNAVGMTLDFAADPANPTVRRWRPKGDMLCPFAVLPDRDHGAVTDPDQASGARGESSGWAGRLILQALACNSVPDYRAIQDEWWRLSERTTALADDAERLRTMFPRSPPDRQSYHQHMQFVVRARDDYGQPVGDYFLEFFSPKAAGDREAVFFHSEVLGHVHTNTRDPSLRCLYIDRTDLMQRFYPMLRQGEARQLAMSISAARIGPNIRYFDKTRDGATGHIVIHRENPDDAAAGEERLHRNATHLVEVIIPRQPVDKVFRLSQ
ncbi:esterase/lipase family protein [Brevundimonas sp.]|uniref:esterase/lipase family protein n=1 Tax=Brevundimonas sp. TaxID=1871086 RepID=UPI00391DE29D